MKLDLINKSLKRALDKKHKKRKRQEEEEEQRSEMTKAHDANLFDVSQSMPDRGPDQKYGDMSQYAHLDRAF